MKGKTRSAARCLALAASAAMVMPAHAVLVFDIPNFFVNKLSLIELGRIRNELHSKDSGTVNYNTLHIEKNTSESYQLALTNYAIDTSFTWIINNSGGEIIPIPGEVQTKLNEILGGQSIEKYTSHYKAAADFGKFPEGGFRDEVAFEGSRSRKAANNALVLAVSKEQEAFASELVALNTLAELAGDKDHRQGQGHQLQVANALAATQVNQMMKLRSMMLVSEAARAAETQVAAEKDARAIAVSNHMRAGLDDAATQSLAPRPKY